MRRLYVEEKWTLRMIAEKFNSNHHWVKRRLVNLGVKITREGRKKKPVTDETRSKQSEAAKKRPLPWAGRPFTKQQLYKNMRAHLQWDVSLEFLMQFNDFEKLKCLNKILGRDRVSRHFTTETYKKFVSKFYFDEAFNRQFEIYASSRKHYDKPSLDHIVPLSRGGSWNLDNLQIISWFDNRAKCDMTQEEYDAIRKKYWGNSNCVR